MEKKNCFSHRKATQTIGLQLYYESHDCSLFILLPTNISGLDQLEKVVIYEKLNKWARSYIMWLYDVQLYIPKFMMAETYDLKSALSSRGINDAFKPEHSLTSEECLWGETYLCLVFSTIFCRTKRTRYRSHSWHWE